MFTTTSVIMFFHYPVNNPVFFNAADKKWAQKPMKQPIMMPDTISTGKYPKTDKSLITTEAARSWPTLCMAEPPTLIPIVLKVFENLFNKKYIASVLNTPPVRLNGRSVIPPANMDVRMDRTATTVSASLNPKNMITMRVIILARPSFTPGITEGTGIHVSIIESIIACATINASSTMCFDFVICPLSLKRCAVDLV
jgi:hypothetical protein